MYKRSNSVFMVFTFVRLFLWCVLSIATCTTRRLNLRNLPPFLNRSEALKRKLDFTRLLPVRNRFLTGFNRFKSSFGAFIPPALAGNAGGKKAFGLFKPVEKSQRLFSYRPLPVENSLRLFLTGGKKGLRPF